jgi:hypothetical protein
MPLAPFPVRGYGFHHDDGTQLPDLVVGPLKAASIGHARPTIEKPPWFTTRRLFRFGLPGEASGAEMRGWTNG